MLSRLLRITMVAALSVWGASALAQTAPVKPRNPGQMATQDRIATHNRATCEREARALKLSYFKRRRFIKGCMQR